MTGPGTDPLDVLQAALDESSKPPWGLVGGTHDREVIDDHGCHVVTTGTFPDAAAIVALRNHADDLLAAIRNVRAVADEFSGYPQPGCTEAATRIRAALGSFGGQQ